MADPYYRYSQVERVLEATRRQENQNIVPQSSVPSSSPKRPLEPRHQQQQNQPQERSAPPVTDKEKMVCSFCNKKGHFRRDCRKHNNLCLACGAPDHRVSGCPSRTETGAPKTTPQQQLCLGGVGYSQQPLHPHHQVFELQNQDQDRNKGQSFLLENKAAEPITEDGTCISDARTAYSGYLPSEGSALAYGAGARATSSEFLKSDVVPLRSGSYGLDDLGRIGSHVTSGFGGLAPGASLRGFPALEGPVLVRRDAGLSVKPGIVDFERPDPLRKSEALPADESKILFVDGLPKDCTRREVAHLFRPFIGFKEIRVLHKEARRSGDKAYVLCFVEFNDSKCALTAMEALQGYKFDDKKPNAPALRIQFAKFPFHPPSLDDRRVGSTSISTLTAK